MKLAILAILTYVLVSSNISQIGSRGRATVVQQILKPWEVTRNRISQNYVEIQDQPFYWRPVTMRREESINSNYNNYFPNNLKIHKRIHPPYQSLQLVESHRPAIRIFADRLNSDLYNKLGLGTNGTGGLIGEFNQIFNSAAEVITDFIRLSLHLIQNYTAHKSQVFLHPLLPKVDKMTSDLVEFITIQLGPGFGQFTYNFTACLRKTFKCHLIPGLSTMCTVHCVLNSIPESSPAFTAVTFMTLFLENVLKFTCDPLRTIFTIKWGFYMKELAPATFLELTDSMTGMGLNMEDLMRIEFEMGFRRNINRILQPIRRFQPMDSIFSGIGRIVSLFKIFNPACYVLEIKSVPGYFFQLFDYDPTFLDTVIGGMILGLDLAKGLPMRGVDRVKEFHKAFDMMTGFNCGVMSWSGAGNGSAICKQRKDLVSKLIDKT